MLAIKPNFLDVLTSFQSAHHYFGLCKNDNDSFKKKSRKGNVVSHTVSESSCPSLGPEMSTLVTGYSGLGGAGQEEGAQDFQGWAGSWVGSYESLNVSCSPGSRPWSSRRGSPGVWEVGESKKGQVMCQGGRGAAPRRGISGVSCPVPVGASTKPLRPHPEVSCAIISLSHPPTSAGLCLGCGLPASQQALQGQANSYTSVLGKG